MAGFHGRTPDRIADSVINVNGELVPSDEPHVSAVDRGFLYGDGVFDSFPIYDSEVLVMDRHIDRLYRSAKGARIDLELSKAELRERIIETIEASGVTDGGVRIVVSRGVGSSIKNADEIESPTIVIIPTHEDRSALPFEDTAPAEVTAKIASTRAIPPDSVGPTIKDCNYLNNAIAEREIAGTDADCAILLNRQGTVSEAFDANVLVVDHRGRLKSPPRTQALPGITREVVLEQARELGIEVLTEELLPAELFSAVDVLLVGSGRGVQTVVELDGSAIGDAPVTDEVIDLTRATYEYMRSSEYIEVDT